MGLLWLVLEFLFASARDSGREGFRYAEFTLGGLVGEVPGGLMHFAFKILHFFIGA